MIPIDCKTGHPWTPPWLKYRPGAPTFLFRGAAFLEREALEAELETLGAGVVYDFQLTAAFKAGVAELLAGDPDGAAQLCDIRSAADADGRGALSASDLAMLVGAEEVLAEHWPAFAVLNKRAARRSAFYPVIAFQRWCVGWSNVKSATGDGEAVFALGFDGRVSEAAMQQVDPMLIRIAGLHAYELQHGGGQAKNCEAGSSADGDPPISGSAKDGAAG